mmetsp:Transcript_32124/g.76363  ORF Transcript_32124/g.76363 Transcript_32124/m.76363 type:complete len:615 (+) Transcript_32124:105-1949(+)
MSAEDAQPHEEAFDYADNQDDTAVDELLDDRDDQDDFQEEPYEDDEKRTKDGDTTTAMEEDRDPDEGHAGDRGNQDEAAGDGGPRQEGDAGKADTCSKKDVDPMSLPPHGTEVFLGGLPRAADEQAVTEFCTRAGELHSLRLVKDPGNSTQQNKGYGFAVYRTKEEAKKAIEQLNQQEVPGFPGKPVRVVLSSVKNRLFVGNVPKDMSKESVEEAVKDVCVGVEVCSPTRPLHRRAGPVDGLARRRGFLPRRHPPSLERVPNWRWRRILGDGPGGRWSPGGVPRKWAWAFTDAFTVGGLARPPQSVEVLLAPDSNLNRGFAFVEFYNHAAAEAGRRALSPPGFVLKGRNLTVTWAEPRKDQSSALSGPPAAAAASDGVKAIYISRIPEDITTKQLEDVFGHFGSIERVAIPPSKKSSKPEFAFVHFHDRTSAVRAVESCKANPPRIGGVTVDVAMARSQPEHRSQPPAGRGGGPPPRSSYGQSYGDMGRRGQGPMYGASLPHSGGPVIDPAGMDFRGMTMVPMILPNGQVGYVLQEAPPQYGGSAYMRGRGSSYGPMRNSSSYGGMGGPYNPPPRAAGGPYPPSGAHYGPEYGSHGGGRSGRGLGTYQSRYRPY